MIFSQLIGNSEKSNSSKAGSAPEVEGFVKDELEKRVRRLNDKFRSNKKQEVEDAYQKALDAYEAKVALERPPEEEGNTYLVESRFLKEISHYLTRDEKEGYCLITGPELHDSLFVLTRMIKTKMVRRSAAGAEPEFGPMLETLSEMEEKHGSRLTAYAHSHPGRGAAATTPSSIDKNTQRKLEQGSYPTVGLIFSRDGYVRFFSHEREFTVEISGNGKEVSNDVIKLD